MSNSNPSWVPPRPPPAPVATGTEGRVCEFIAERQAMGIAKYGTTVSANPLHAGQWLQHFREELADALVYATTRLQEEVNRLLDDGK